MRVNLLYSLSLLNYCVSLSDHIKLAELDEFVRQSSELSIANLFWCCGLQPYSFKFFEQLLMACDRQGAHETQSSLRG
eukprot:16433507-Heterocapsa_arctica.AAC.1